MGAAPEDLLRVSQSIRLTLFRDVAKTWLETNAAVVREVGLDPVALATMSRRDLLAALRALPAAQQTSKSGRRIVNALINLDPSELPDTML